MEIRRLTPDDLTAMLRLCDVAGWNQTESDLHRLLALEPDGCFAAWDGGRLVGTTTTTTYGTALAWVGMVLVDPAFRRRGIASALIEAALEYLRRCGVTTVKLDATPEGRGVYERFGFVPECVLERWEVVAPPPVGGEVSRGTWDAIAAGDRAAFGADRGALLRSLIADTRPPVVVEDVGNDVIGYAFARPGSRAWYVGPVVADDIGAARTLLAVTLPGLGGGPVFVDVNVEFPGAVDLLRDRGFARRRDLLRMRLGPDAGVGRSPRVFAIAGPEVG